MFCIHKGFMVYHGLIVQAVNTFTNKIKTIKQLDSRDPLVARAFRLLRGDEGVARGAT